MTSPRDGALPESLAYLAWNPVEVRVGETVLRAGGVVSMTPGWEGFSIRDCSYAAAGGIVGMAARDPGHDGDALVVAAPGEAPRVVLRAERLLHHALAPSGATACFTRPSTGSGAADLWLHRLEEDRSELLLENAVAQGCQPSWFPDGARIVYHTPDGFVEALAADGTGRERLAEGTLPAAAPGGRIAFVRDGDVWVRDPAGAAERMPVDRALLRRDLSDGLSWSSDATYLSYGRTAGLVGKETAFYILNVATGESRKCPIDHMSALRLIAPASEV